MSEEVVENPETPEQPEEEKIPEVDLDSDEILAVGMKCDNIKFEAVMPDTDIASVDTYSYRGKFLLLISYPLDYVVISASEIIALTENYQRFLEANTDIIAFSADSCFTHIAWINQPRTEGGIGYSSFPICTDAKLKIAKKFGLEDENGNILRGSVLIDPDGEIKHISKQDPNVPRSVEELLRLTKAYIFARENGSVCPASWHEGERAIQPSDAKSYFAERFSEE